MRVAPIGARVVKVATAPPAVAPFAVVAAAAATIAAAAAMPASPGAAPAAWRPAVGIAAVGIAAVRTRIKVLLVAVVVSSRASTTAAVPASAATSAVAATATVATTAAILSPALSMGMSRFAIEITGVTSRRGEMVVVSEPPRTPGHWSTDAAAPTARSVQHRCGLAHPTTAAAKRPFILFGPPPPLLLLVLLPQKGLHGETKGGLSW